MVSLQRLLSGDIQFRLKHVLYIMHLCGQVSLPGHYKEPWKTQLHRIYTAFNWTLSGAFCLSVALGLFLNTIKEFGLFSERCFVFGAFLLCFCSNCLLNVKLKKFLTILDFFEALAERHRDKPVVVMLKKMESLFLLALFAMTAQGLTWEFLIYPLLPKSDEELETLIKLYNLKHPHNSLPFQPYIPYVDTSEPKIFYILYALFVYIGFLHLAATVFYGSLFPFSVFHLKTGFIILKEYTQMVGKPHFNSSGQPVFYTNLFDNEEMVLRPITQDNQQVTSDCQEDGQLCDVQAPRLARLGISMSTDTHHHNLPRVYFPLDGISLSHTDCLNKAQETQINIPGGNIRKLRSLCYDKSIRRLFKDNPTLYESFYLVQLMVFHKRLMQQRNLMDDYFQDMFMPLTVIVIVMLIVSMFAGFMPLLPGIVRLKMIIMASGILGYIFVIFYCGELLASCNESLATTLWLSRWYTCSQGTIRNMILFLRMNQKQHYFLIMRKWKLSYRWMIGVVRFAYSVFNVMRIRKQRSG
uniref:Odorant receptor n=1 Tax=Cacopsylla melanoneura TaxID=428564 RepID=A0A8D8QQJ4_9HEMI